MLSDYETAVKSIHPSGFEKLDVDITGFQNEVELRFILTALEFKEMLIFLGKIPSNTPRLLSNNLVIHYNESIREYRGDSKIKWQRKIVEESRELDHRRKLARSTEWTILDPCPSVQVKKIRQLSRIRFTIGNDAFVDMTLALEAKSEHGRALLLKMADEAHKKADATSQPETDEELFQRLDRFLEMEEIGMVRAADGLFLEEVFSLEIELLHPNALSKVENIITRIESGFEDLRHVTDVYDEDARIELPRALSRDDFGPGSVTYKLDGDFARLIFTEESVLWQSRIGDTEGTAIVIAKNTTDIRGAIDAEFYQGQSAFRPINHRNIRFHVFQTQSKSTLPVGRFSGATDKTLSLFLTVKPVFVFNNREEMKVAVAKCVKRMTTFRCDGLVFYFPDHKKSKSESPKVKMCKFKNYLSIDMLAMDYKLLAAKRLKLQNNAIPILCFAKETTQAPGFFGSAVVENRERSSLNGTVVECQYDFSTAQFVYMRTRPDKLASHLNSVAAFKEVDSFPFVRRAIAQIINISSPSLMSRIHNIAKSSIIRLQATSNHVMDVGSGIGGDVGKYKKILNTTQVTLVEPDLERIVELERRIEEFDVKPKIEKTQLQDVVASLYIKNKGVNTVNMFFCINLIPPTYYGEMFAGFHDQGAQDVHIMFMDCSKLDAEVQSAALASTGEITAHWTSSADWEIHTPIWSAKAESEEKYSIDLTRSATATQQIEFRVSSDLLIESAKRAGFVKETSSRVVDLSGNKTAHFMVGFEERLSSCYRYIHFQTKETKSQPPKKKKDAQPQTKVEASKN